MAGFERSMREMFSNTARNPRPSPEQALAGLAPQIADSRAAFALVRKRAAELGLFGAPSFRVGGELFWGNDRLEDALGWAVADVP